MAQNRMHSAGQQEGLLLKGANSTQSILLIQEQEF